MTVAGTARILQLPAQPAQPVLQQCDGVAALWGGHRGVGGIGRIEQLHQGRRQLFGGAPLRLALECMPLAIVDGEQSMQDLRCFSAAFWPLLMG